MKYFTCLLLVFIYQCQASSKYLPGLIELNNTQYDLCQNFTLRYGLVIKIADIGWYAPNCDESSVISEQTDKIIRFHYHKNVSADFFKESAEEYFLLNLENQSEHDLLYEHLTQFNDAYTDIKSGEYFDLVHWNDEQLSLWKNKQLLVKINHTDFARKYLNIWFGKVPVIKKLKSAFL